MEDKSKYRKVNVALGKQPNIGPFPADQLIPWAIICGISYYLAHGLFRLNWVWTCSISAWGIATWWIITANGAWRILSKFVATPRWTRVRCLYQPIVNSKQIKKAGGRRQKAEGKNQ
ncbi:hypothetical protein [Calothrix sp. UHCC 0171]|uniref:hypothetical protein n=1 Tax=Calothrix sp. UHCC 0171 TaxID=3110245 RepID=UPI002B20FE0C|nr:hypothetical protein [Calothrix sp. UHCC 0171]MEA5573422.1 hypothetical protein [Calothrix sp. UHCC 0171]